MDRRVLAGLRVAVLPAALAAHQLDDRHGLDPFAPVFAAAAVYAAATFLWRRPAAWLAAVDVAFLAALTYRGDGFVATQLLLLAVVGVLLAVLGTARSASGESRRLVAAVAGAEERERERLASVLHDGPVQHLMHARGGVVRAQHEGAPGLDGAERSLAEALNQLRGTMRGLHPYVLDLAGLGPALETVATDAAASGVRCHVEVADDAVGDRDQLVYSLARELVSNAVRHAQARNVWLSVTRREESIELQVADDGLGFDDRRRAASVRAGHIGLALCAHRVEALGGTFELRSVPGEGTEVRALLPPGATMEVPPPPEAAAVRPRRRPGGRSARPGPPRPAARPAP